MVSKLDPVPRSPAELELHVAGITLKPYCRAIGPAGAGDSPKAWHAVGSPRPEAGSPFCSSGASPRGTPTFRAGLLRTVALVSAPPRALRLGEGLALHNHPRK